MIDKKPPLPVRCWFRGGALPRRHKKIPAPAWSAGDAVFHPSFSRRADHGLDSLPQRPVRPVFWLPDQPKHRAFPFFIHSGLVAMFVPGYSGGSATDFHRLPVKPFWAHPTALPYPNSKGLSSGGSGGRTKKGFSEISRGGVISSGRCLGFDLKGFELTRANRPPARDESAKREWGLCTRRMPKTRSRLLQLLFRQNLWPVSAALWLGRSFLAFTAARGWLFRRYLVAFYAGWLFRRSWPAFGVGCFLL